MERCDADVEKRNGCWMLELAELDASGYLFEPVFSAGDDGSPHLKDWSQGLNGIL